MLGLMIVGAFAAYVYLAIKITKYIRKKTNSVKLTFLSTITFILIPTWDVIIGYPVWQKYKKESGVKIYKTVNNVEGFYIGEQSREHEPCYPYAGYKYIEYKETESGKYFRSYHLDNNTSKLCVPPSEIYKYGRYNKEFANGKCIAKQEIKENEVSRWLLSTNFGGNYIEGSKEEIVSPFFGITHKIVLVVIDRSNNEKLGRWDYFWWQAGWVSKLLASFTYGAGGTSCGLDKNITVIGFVNSILEPEDGK